MTEIDRVEPKGNGIAQHSSASNEHYTPRTIIEVCRETMGSIELDPASCDLANRQNVRAHRYFTKEDDALSKPWDAKTIFVNPPGGKLKYDAPSALWIPVKHGFARSSAQIYWHHAVETFMRDRTRTICFLGFTLELMRLSQWRDNSVFLWPVTRFPFCVLRSRTDFLIEENGKLVEQGDPTHANVLACITSSMSVAMRFRRLAEPQLGAVVVPFDGDYTA